MRGMKGFTLMETVIVAALVGVVGLSFAFLFSTAQRFMMQSVNLTTTQGDASFAAEHIRRHAIVASEVSVPAEGTTDDELRFRWQPNAEAAVRESLYRLVGTDLQFIADTAAMGTIEVVSRGIINLEFIRSAGGGTIAIDLTAEKTSGTDTRQMQIRTNVSPRGLI